MPVSVSIGGRACKGRHTTPVFVSVRGRAYAGAGTQRLCLLALGGEHMQGQAHNACVC